MIRAFETPVCLSLRRTLVRSEMNRAIVCTRMDSQKVLKMIEQLSELDE